MSVAIHILKSRGWQVEKITCYDEGIEGWKWTSPLGYEEDVIGMWEDDPPLPEELLKKLGICIVIDQNIKGWISKSGTKWLWYCDVMYFWNKEYESVGWTPTIDKSPKVDEFNADFVEYEIASKWAGEVDEQLKHREPSAIELEAWFHLSVK